MANWKTELRRHREEKDAYLKQHPRSPIPPEERSAFNGLSYFDPDRAYRFELELHEYETPESLTVETTQEGEQTYTAIGELRFNLHGTERSLTVYEPADGNEMWVPFRDETSGETTYGAGRYVEIEETDDGTWILDFNYAYSPFCAYSEKYECPLVPRDNWLETPVEAGEQYEEDD